MHKWKPDEIWYLTDSRQALHFEIVFRAAKKAQIVNEDTNLEFIPFGTMNGIDLYPISYRIGLIATPLREYPENPYLRCCLSCLPH